MKSKLEMTSVYVDPDHAKRIKREHGSLSRFIRAAMARDEAPKSSVDITTALALHSLELLIKAFKHNKRHKEARILKKWQAQLLELTQNI